MNILTDFSRHTCDGSAEFDRLVVQRDWKRCPGRTFMHRRTFLTVISNTACGAVVEHDGGCLHMTVLFFLVDIVAN